ncbi:hypothetical protein [Vibrio aestuarianus]|uniref:hypothetical protein n=1 Tax=Vibrio aestuarianus TaxID=28171 RepID=UPI001593069B|nr:hypothetical protein [Vibrio aestuarianus]MDE1236835.1 hypothetical protein [Vibrio aestuarianus]MDE1247771.1 hypothetical protein [Vibrio aestuarianus]NGZ64906.1 hypothetical protein [Vibrio aestuarianus subsp. cardii]
MTYNINSLATLLNAQPELPILVSALSGMLEAGYRHNSLSATIRAFCRSKNLPEDYEDTLDDLVAAMEGWCDKDYILHPSHYTEVKCNAVI